MAPKKTITKKKAAKPRRQPSRPSRSSRRQAQPQPPQSRPQSSPPLLRADLAWSEHGFRGVLVEGGRYVQCELPTLRPQNPNHFRCTAKIRNEERALQSHYGKEHVGTSAHARDTEKHAGRPYKCAESCGADHASWTEHLAQIRSKRHHKWTGPAARIKKAGYVLNAGDEEEQDDDDDDNLPEDQPFWEGNGNGNGGQGPSGGAAGGLIAA
ncbi:hypothetical protein PG996_013550 [Apiospora saccharicola]|uniref:C2H2-type domain-containing protein n=1 Tax=Apiospora saccharicola TaxID=335842 RepID=A0ABR1U5S3_9PEZI